MRSTGSDVESDGTIDDAFHTVNPSILRNRLDYWITIYLLILWSIVGYSIRKHLLLNLLSVLLGH